MWGWREHDVTVFFFRISLERGENNASEESTSCRGRIQRITIQKEQYHLRHGRVRYRKRYYLIVERMDISIGQSNEIKSSPYRVPLPYYLTSREVTLYCDSTGWNWYIEDLKCSFFRQKNVEMEVDDYGDGGYTGQNIFRIVFIVGILWIFVSELFH